MLRVLTAQYQGDSNLMFEIRISSLRLVANIHPCYKKTQILKIPRSMPYYLNFIRFSDLRAGA